VAGLGLKEAKILAERGGQVGGPMDEEQANLVKSRLELLGAKVSLQ
jgi:ribosomal protein L7/L12